MGDGVSDAVHGIASGMVELDDARSTPRSRDIYVTRAKSLLEPDLSELADLGARPFRHLSWNRQHSEEYLKDHNPFIHGVDAFYWPECSVHSPEQVQTLRRELARVTDRVRRTLDRVKSKRLRADAIENFENELVRAIESAAEGQRAVYAAWDC